MSQDVPEALRFADDRPTSTGDDLYQWAIDAEDLLRRQHAEIKRLRGCLLWLLWHHQGASSPTGQPIRRALGIDKHAPMTEAQIEAGQRFGVGAACAAARGVRLEGEAPVDPPRST